MLFARHLLRLCKLAVMLGIALSAQGLAAQTPLVFAAASLSEALRAASAQLEPTPRLSFGGSGTMARQIDQGAPADVVILANPLWMDWLERRGHLEPGSRKALLSNRLVLVGPPGAEPLTTLSAASVLARLGDGGRLAMGAHLSVPAGQYAKMWLETVGLWDVARPRLAETENVRAALALVSRAEVPLAIVYASDLVAAPQAASVVWTIADSEQPPIRYTIAALSPAGQQVVTALQTPQARQIFARYGFDTEGLPE